LQFTHGKTGYFEALLQIVHTWFTNSKGISIDIVQFKVSLASSRVLVGVMYCFKSKAQNR